MLSADTIRQAVVDLEEPVVFTGFQENVEGSDNPEFLRWNLATFVKILGDETIPFRTGDNARTSEPQWDIKCPMECMTMSQFLEKAATEDQQKWHYFDYKYMHQWFEDRPEILESIDWKRFGFRKTGNDSTLWIGSRGAHTNCHQDSYGCNLIAQLHGRKQWILFPPDSGDSIKPTRVPYEESTVYSKLNFFCPTLEDEEAIVRMKESARIVELEPGQVMLVPHGWWHYVESLETSVSINVWLPVPADRRGRLKEAIVKLLVTNIGDGVPSAPEEIEYSRREVLDLINTCVRECNDATNATSSSDTPAEKRPRDNRWTARDLAREYPSSVKLLGARSDQEFREIIRSKRERFAVEDISPRIQDDDRGDKDFQRSLESVFNALCHCDVVNKVADVLLGDRLL